MFWRRAAPHFKPTRCDAWNSLCEFVYLICSLMFSQILTGRRTGQEWCYSIYRKCSTVRNLLESAYFWHLYTKCVGDALTCHIDVHTQQWSTFSADDRANHIINDTLSSTDQCCCCCCCCSLSRQRRYEAMITNVVKAVITTTRCLVDDGGSHDARVTSPHHYALPVPAAVAAVDLTAGLASSMEQWCLSLVSSECN